MSVSLPAAPHAPVAVLAVGLHAQHQACTLQISKLPGIPSWSVSVVATTLPADKVDLEELDSGRESIDGLA